MEPQGSRWLRGVAVGVLVVAVALLALAVVPVLMMGLAFGGCVGQPDRFEAEAWRSDEVGDMCSARRGMVDDLLAGDELQPGRPREEVERLLGPTEDVDYWLSEEEGLVYVTGCWIDCDWLIVEFDDRGRLVQAYTGQD